ncbi:MAG TPA: ABC transporter ATP-binding protein/permease [Roseiarcus sp.]|nr:ABC transporter ATP-binding protein/permease [Roseiarcus sp.]
MIAALWASRQRNTIVFLAVALIAIVGVTAYAQVRLNAWNEPFYDALAHKNVSGFVRQLAVFAELAGILLALNVAQTWLNQKSKLVLREGVVEDLLAEWLSPARAFRLSQAGDIGANPDQRIQEDAKHLTELTTDLGIGLLQSTLLLLSFIGVLWVLSDKMVLAMAGYPFVPRGYMVWCALIYAGLASFVSWRVGRPLISLNAERRAREADCRFALVRANDEVEGVTLCGGEADERARLQGVFSIVVAVAEQLVRAVTGLTGVTAGYGWFTIVAPILVAAPAYFNSGMTFGELMMLVGAFNQVQQSLRWFVDNFPSIADWRATLLRVASFRNTLSTMDDLGRNAGQIEVAETDDGCIRMDDLAIAAPSSPVKPVERHVELKPGERVLVIGDEAQEALMFRAVSGLWPWGSGRIARPPRESIIFVSAPGYIPPGTLRSALSYPRLGEASDPATVSDVLATVGLDYLKPLLNKEDRWDRRLSDAEKQRLSVARVILQKPRWVVLNQAMAGLDPETRRRIEAVFDRDLANVGVLNIGRYPNESGFTRSLRLAYDPNHPCSRPFDAAEDQNVEAAAPAL